MISKKCLFIGIFCLQVQIHTMKEEGYTNTDLYLMLTKILDDLKIGCTYKVEENIKGRFGDNLISYVSCTQMPSKNMENENQETSKALMLYKGNNYLQQIKDKIYWCNVTTQQV